MDKAVVTLVGMDSVGIIDMVMIVDLGTGSKGFDNVKNDMDNMSKKVKCVINIVKYDDLEALAEE